MNLRDMACVEFQVRLGDKFRVLTARSLEDRQIAQRIYSMNFEMYRLEREIPLLKEKLRIFVNERRWLQSNFAKMVQILRPSASHVNVEMYPEWFYESLASIVQKPNIGWMEQRDLKKLVELFPPQVDVNTSWSVLLRDLGLVGARIIDPAIERASATEIQMRETVARSRQLAWESSELLEQFRELTE